LNSVAVTPEQYRAHYWATDAEQWRFALVLFLVPTVLFVWFDYQLNGTTWLFYGFVAMRVAMASYSLWLIFALRRLQNRRLLERLLLLWTLCGITVFALNALGRPPEFFGHYVFEVFALMLFFSAMPMQPGAQLAVGITYLVVALPILFFYKQPPTAVYTSNTAAVMLLTVISGYLIARRIRDYRVDALVAQLKLEHQARTDALTGIANRRAFLDAAHQELSRVNRSESPLTVLMLDIDHFKKVNDRFGHDVGDDLLAEFARRIEKGLRGYDQFARLGGEEFAVMLPGCNLEQAVATAERLRHAISAEPFAVRGNIVPMTVSIGVGIVREFEMTIDGVLTRADTALYAAKDNGRDRVEVVE